MNTKAKIKAVNKYNSKNYKSATCRFRIQDIEIYNNYATKCRVSTNSMITSCINYCINNNIDITGGIKLNQSEGQQEEINGTATDDSGNLD